MRELAEHVERKLGYHLEPAETLKEYVARICVDPKLLVCKEELVEIAEACERAFYADRGLSDQEIRRIQRLHVKVEDYIQRLPPVEPSRPAVIAREPEQELEVMEERIRAEERQAFLSEIAPAALRRRICEGSRCALNILAHARANPARLTFIVLLLITSLSLMLYDIRLPGPAMDDLGYFYGLLHLDLFRPHIESATPLLIFSYGYASIELGPIYTFAALPFFYIFGISVESARLVPISFALATVVLVFLFCEDFFNRDVAYVASILVATSPVFVFHGRLGCDVGRESFIIMLLLLCLFKWKRSGRLRYALISSFVLGFGLLGKINILWLPLSLVLAYPLFRPNVRIQLRWIPCLFVCFLIGSLPFWLSELYVHPWGVLNFLLHSPTQASSRPLMFMIEKRLYQFRTTLLEGDVSTVYGEASRNTIMPVLFPILTAFGLFSVATRADRVKGKRFLFLFFVFNVLLWGTLYSPTSTAFHHVLITTAFPEILMSASLSLLLSLSLRRCTAPRRRLKIGAYVLLVTVLVSGNLIAIHGTYESLKRTGGRDYRSDAIYAVADYLIQNNVTRPIAVDWNFRQIMIITRGEVYPIDIYGYWYETDPDLSAAEITRFIERCKTLFLDPSRVYLFHTPKYTRFDRFSLFEQAAKSMGKSVTLIKTFSQRDGEPIILIYSVK